MRKVPTDLQILNAIYDAYYDEFCRNTEENPTRASKIFVPIDLERIASDFGVNGDIIFGRLYYDLENRYGYKTGTNTSVAFFTMQAGGDRHAINVPYMASVLAGLRDEHRKYRVATAIAFISLVVSIASIVISLA